ncbi:MAG: hypothetical protein E7665_04325 [Ruminococcaceae bacterium]|nr:hypothetical protein [Oscillospiraceae bacterium]
MRVIVKLLIPVLCLFMLFGCTFEQFQPDRAQIIDNFKANRDIFAGAVDEALAYEKDMYISTSDKYPVKDSETDENIVGVYSADVNEAGVSAYRSISSSAFNNLFTICGVDAIATSYSEELSVCEFNCGGSGRYYFGVYYTNDGSPLFLGDYGAELKESENGFSYKTSDITYYTEKIEDNFYYFEAIY